MQRPFQPICAKVDLISVALEFAGHASQLVDIRDHRAKHFGRLPALGRECASRLLVGRLMLNSRTLKGAVRWKMLTLIFIFIELSTYRARAISPADGTYRTSPPNPHPPFPPSTRTLPSSVIFPRCCRVIPSHAVFSTK